MLTTVCQRWNKGRASWRAAREPFDPRAFEVASIPDDTTARAFVEANHYSRSYPPARRRHGLYTRGELVGVAVFSAPMVDSVLRPWDRTSAMELGRLVLLDHVAANAESWFVRRALELLRVEGLAGVVSYSDPEPRTNAAGESTFAGHIGTVYQSLGAVYTGLGAPKTQRLLADGREFSNRAASKIRKGERGVRYAVQQLVDEGAREPAPGEDLRAWLREEVARLTRPQRHQGNHRFCWGLTEGARRDLARGPSLSYPKFNARSCRVVPIGSDSCASLDRRAA